MEQDFSAFRLTVLRELSGLRQEVRELRLALQRTPAAPPQAAVPPAPPWREVFRGSPSSLEKRLEPLLAQEPPDETPSDSTGWA